MEHLADEFIQRRCTVVVGRGKRYPEPLRQLAVVFATEAEAAQIDPEHVVQATEETRA